MGKQPQLQVGWMAPELMGATAAGEAFRLKELRPRPVLVEFHRGTWETRCEFEPLAPVNPIWSGLDSIALYPSAEQRHREAIEPVKVHRQFLDEILIRPYAVCETPPFVGMEPAAPAEAS